QPRARPGHASQESATIHAIPIVLVIDCDVVRHLSDSSPARFGAKFGPAAPPGEVSTPRTEYTGTVLPDDLGSRNLPGRPDDDRRTGRYGAGTGATSDRLERGHALLRGPPA